MGWEKKGEKNKKRKISDEMESRFSLKHGGPRTTKMMALDKSAPDGSIDAPLGANYHSPR